MKISFKVLFVLLITGLGFFLQAGELNERPKISSAKTWTLKMEYHGAVVRNPISTTITIDSSGEMTLKKSDQMETLIKNITEDELSTLKTAINKAYLLNQRDVNYVGIPCVGSKGVTVNYIMGKRVNKFEISGAALCNIRPRKLKNLMDEIKQLRVKYFLNVAGLETVSVEMSL
ncbi:MAG: hypothetical protein HY877_00350 [Deltaproteobacteria bacterium]|nr:hypothetical protein [Deltaproteobacteria bacterium]